MRLCRFTQPILRIGGAPHLSYFLTELLQQSEAAWQLESVESRLVADNRLTQDYDDIDYTSGNLVSFHTSLAR